MKKVLAIIAMVLIVGGLAGGLTAVFAGNGGSGTEQKSMTASEAMDLAKNCACEVGGWFTGEVFYNEATGTWWLDLDVKKDGCAPACVVNVETGEVEINWRCTGLLPPEGETETGWEQVGVPLVGCTPPNLPGDGVPPEKPGQAVAPAHPEPIDSDVVAVPAPIESVEVLILESFPPRYNLRVVSGLPNGCTSFGGYSVDRDGNMIRVTMTNLVPAPSDPPMFCTMIYGLEETVISLGSDFGPGKTYTVDVNGVIETFTAQ